MTLENQSISTIIPAYNSGRFVADAVNSVLNQTHPCDEIIVVDDGSTDNTAEVLKRFGTNIRYIYQENRGPSASRNRGIQEASGALICFLDADDLWLSNKLERQMRFMVENPQVGLLFTDEQWSDAVGGEVLRPSFLARRKCYSLPAMPATVSDAVERLIVENFILTSSVMLRRQCLEVAGNFDETFQVSEDRDLWSRIAAHFPIAVLPEVLAVKRIHSSNISSNQELTLCCRIRLWKKTHRQFPELVSPATVHAMLAKTHLQLALRLFKQNKASQARRELVHSLSYAVRRARNKSRFAREPYPWSLAVALFPASLVGPERSRRLKRLFSPGAAVSQNSDPEQA